MKNLEGQDFVIRGSDLRPGMCFRSDYLNVVPAPVYIVVSVQRDSNNPKRICASLFRSNPPGFVYELHLDTELAFSSRYDTRIG